MKEEIEQLKISLKEMTETADLRLAEIERVKRENKKLREENAELKNINEQHRKLNGEIRKEINELKKQKQKILDYISEE